jgi:DeoR family transcriptional regulator, aga operon transcriptional repressor
MRRRDGYGTKEGAIVGSPDRTRRWRQVLDLLAQRGQLSVAEAATELGVSEATVRRDFAKLDRQQLATRTHGGVVATSVAYHLPARYRSADGDSPKERIARAAADLVASGTVVGFNGGTTTTAAARSLATRLDLVEASERPAVTVVTNALNIAAELVLRPHIRTVSVGGVARPQSYELIGPLVPLVLAELWMDILLLGVDGVSSAGGASCRDEGEAGVNALMVQRASRVIVLATGEKLGRRAFARICDVADLTTVVTDGTADDGEIAALRREGIEVRVV